MRSRSFVYSFNVQCPVVRRFLIFYLVFLSNTTAVPLLLLEWPNFFVFFFLVFFKDFATKLDHLSFAWMHFNTQKCLLCNFCFSCYTHCIWFLSSILGQLHFYACNGTWCPLVNQQKSTEIKEISLRLLDN